MKKLFLLLLLLVTVIGVSTIAPSANAAPTEGTDSNPTVRPSPLVQDSQCKAGDNQSCVGTIQDDAAELACDTADDNCNIVRKYLDPFIQMLAVIVGLAVTVGIIVGGIQYASSAGDPQKVSSAKIRIRNSIVALILFFFLYALLQFLIPGRGLLAN